MDATIPQIRLYPYFSESPDLYPLLDRHWVALGLVMDRAPAILLALSKQVALKPEVIPLLEPIIRNCVPGSEKLMHGLCSLTEFTEPWMLKLLRQVPGEYTTRPVIELLWQDSHGVHGEESRKHLMHWRTIVEPFEFHCLQADHIYWHLYAMGFTTSFLHSFNASIKQGRYSLPGFFEQITTLEMDRQRMQALVKETHQIQAVSLREFKTYNQFKGDHDLLTQAIGKKNYTEFKKTDLYPPAPIPPTDQIHHLSNRHSLAREGQFMDHCVWTYEDMVKLGEYAVYHYHSGKHGFTIGLTRKGWKWCIDQVQGFRNSPPPGHIMHAIREWLKASQDQLNKGLNF